MPYALYIASALGALALLLMMPRPGFTPVKLGLLLGAFALGGLWLFLINVVGAPLGLPDGAMPYYYVFSAIAIGAAARVITHDQPVYAALWFVMVVLASAGLFLTLSAEFMAFAMIIIYAGAILVTYMFVIMLAAQSTPGTDEDPSAQPAEYDRVAREPLAACGAGFLLLAVLLSVFFQPMSPNPDAAAPSDAQVAATTLPDRAADRVAAQRRGLDADAPAATAVALENVERVGLDLFQRHPLGIELAGVILLVSLIGAVVIARTRVEAPSRT